LTAIAERVGEIKGSPVVALGALTLSLVSVTLFAVGVNGDPHEGPFRLAFFALLWPVFLCPLSCLSVAVWPSSRRSGISNGQPLW
jgi:hypothetical protein